MRENRLAGVDLAGEKLCISPTLIVTSRVGIREKMQIFSKLFGSPGIEREPVNGVSLWRQWVRNPKAARWLLREEDVLRLDDVCAVEDWADKMVEWGMHVRMHAGVAGVHQVIEVFGPDLAVPHVLLYRVGEEIQVDEFHGASRRCADMPHALDYVTSCT